MNDGHRAFIHERSAVIHEGVVCDDWLCGAGQTLLLVHSRHVSIVSIASVGGQNERVRKSSKVIAPQSRSLSSMMQAVTEQIQVGE